MGIQEVKKMLHSNQHLHDTRVEDHRHDGQKKVWVLGLAGIALPLPQLKPIKTGLRRRPVANDEEHEEEEEPVTPRGEGCRIPAEASTCPPAPKKPRTAVAVIRNSAVRRCNYDDGGEMLEFFRVPADLEAVFVSRAAKAN